MSPSRAPPAANDSAAGSNAASERSGSNSAKGDGHALREPPGHVERVVVHIPESLELFTTNWAYRVGICHDYLLILLS